MVQRYGAALILSHHWNKTGNGDPHSRTSGVGLTAWGRFLISIELPNSNVDVDHTTGRTSVHQRWHIKGDEVLTESFDVERTVWTDDQFKLTSDMHYELKLLDDSTAKKREPLKNVTMMAQVSEILADHLDGLGMRAIKREWCELTNRRSISTKNLQIVLNQLVLHGYITTTEVQKGQTKPYFHIKPFEKPARREPSKASIKEADFSNVQDD
jgi:hypothetical protein